MLRPSGNYKPNGKVLSDEGRQNYADYLDSIIKQFSEGLELLKGKYTSNKSNDASDSFVGIYSISVTEYVVWGNDSGTLTNTGTLTITKISDTQVRASGFFYDTGIRH